MRATLSSVDTRDADLAGSTFTRVDLSRARFEQVELRDAFLRNVYLTGARLRGAWLERVDIDGELLGLTVNGVDVGPLVEAELDRRHPERVLVRAAGEEGAEAVPTAWAAVRDAWDPVLERARALPEPLLHARVDDEYSFLETLRHLVFCTDAWLRRAVLGEPAPFWVAGVPHDELEDDTPVPVDAGADPGLAEVLAARAERVAAVDATLAALTDERLDGTTTVTGQGYPAAGDYAVRRCVMAVVREEQAHRLFAVRDLAVLEERSAGGRGTL